MATSQIACTLLVLVFIAIIMELVYSAPLYSDSLALRKGRRSRSKSKSAVTAKPAQVRNSSPVNSRWKSDPDLLEGISDQVYFSLHHSLMH